MIQLQRLTVPRLQKRYGRGARSAMKYKFKDRTSELWMYLEKRLTGTFSIKMFKWFSAAAAKYLLVAEEGKESARQGRS